MTPTAEQAKVLALCSQGFDKAKTFLLSLIAGAGCGKTSTIIQVVLANPETSFLYLAFNRSIKLELDEKVKALGITNLTVLTQNAWAKQLFETANHCRIQPELKIKNKQISKWCQIKNDDASLASHLLKDYMIGTSELIKDQKISGNLSQRIEKRILKKLGEDDQTKEYGTKRLELIRTIIQFTRKNAKTVWGRMLIEKIYTHDSYVKLTQLDDSILDGRFQCILLDEAQDINPTFSRIIDRHLAQGVSIVAVGDPNQAIYAFRGAVNYFESIKPDQELTLRESFRFGQTIAEKANIVLKYLGDFQLIGRGSGEESNGRKAFLQRTNAGALMRAIDCMRQGEAFFLDSAISKEEIALFKQLKALNDEKFDLVFDSDLKGVESIRELQRLIDKQIIADEWKRRLYFVDLLGGFHCLLENLKIITDTSALNKDNPSACIITTGHKSKGQEFDHVTIGADFLIFFRAISYVGGRKNIAYSLSFGNADELKLLYVAMTRARVSLDLSGVDALFRNEKPLEPALGSIPIEIANGVYL